MKKHVLFFLLFICIFTGLHAKSVVLYFGTSGTTEAMSKKTAEALSADIIEIIPVHKYTAADLDWNDYFSLTSVECCDPKARPKIENSIDISEYDTVVLCYPIWWGYAPKIMYTFAESQKWDGKKLITFCTSSGSGIGISGKELAKHARGAIYCGGRDFSTGTPEEIREFVADRIK